MVHDTLPLVLVSASGAPTAELAERIAAAGPVTVVAQESDVARAARAYATHAARVVLFVADSARGPALVKALMLELRAPVVVLAVTSKIAMDSMAAGALEAMPLETPAQQIVESLQLMSSVRVVQRHPDRGGGAAASLHAHAHLAESRLVVIGASTGGPPALSELLGRLPADFSAAVVIAQHMPDDYDEPFATWLSQHTKLAVKVARDGERASPGTVYLARGGHDLVVGPGQRLSNQAPLGRGPVPSADRLLESASRLPGVALFGAILTGMGRDGAEGLLAMRKAGASTVVQDAHSSVVFSMPETALARRAADDAIPPFAIAERLVAWAERR